MTEFTSDSTSFGAALATVDHRPFFARALEYAVRHRVIDADKLDAIRVEGAKGIVQIAGFFGTAHLRANIDTARDRIVALASLYLEESCEGKLARAALSLRDNTFLSHSRGGSNMLKELQLMPEYAIFGEHASDDDVKRFLDVWSLRGNGLVKAYRKALADRQEARRWLTAARFFGMRMGMHIDPSDVMAGDELFGKSAEQFIRTAILVRLADEARCPSDAELVRMLETWRAKGLTAKRLAVLEAPDEGIPEEYRDIERKVAGHILKHDIPLILDKKRDFREVVNVLGDLYFFHSADVHDVSKLDALAAQEWNRITQGRTEPDARLTVFVCLAAGEPPKPSLTEAAAKKLAKKIRAEGMNLAVVRQFITQHAPFDLQESLLALWDEEFIPEAEIALFDERDEKLVRAMGFLRENLRITAAPKKKA